MTVKYAAFALALIPCAALAADPAPVSVKNLCQQLTEYQPSADVEYVPGKDVHGRAVAPADLDGGSAQIKMADEITVAIGTDTLQQLNLPANAGYTPYVNLGRATIKKDGSLYFNGKRLSQAQVQTLCKDGGASNSVQTPPQSPPVSQ